MEGYDTMKNIIYGYCRISTVKQKIQRQIDNIKREYPEAVIITEEYTGTTTNRPNWNKLYKQAIDKASKGEAVTIVFDEVSRMSRNANEGVKLYEELYNMGIELVFIKEPHINTNVYREATKNSIEMTGNEIADEYIKATNKVMMILAKKQIQIAFEQAQKEVDYLHQRTKEGIETARLNGKRIGLEKGSKLTTKKSIEAKEIIRKHNKSFGGSLSNEETWKLAGISKMTFYKYKDEIRLEMN